MRLALIADIHGNLVALDTVLQELAQETIDQIVCLGDVAALGPQPHEVIDRLRGLKCPVIVGNTDVWLLAPPGGRTSDSETLRAITAWCGEQLTPEDRAYLHTFVPLLELPLDDGKTVLCYYGSPRSFDDVIASVTADSTVQQMLAGHSATIMVGGHTHIQMARRYEDAYLVGAGSVGLPGVNAGTPELPRNQHVQWAEYGVISMAAGRVSIDLRRTPLDMTTVLSAGRSSGMPHVEWWVNTWET